MRNNLLNAEADAVPGVNGNGNGKSQLVSRDRVYLQKLAWANALTGLTPAKIVSQIQEFAAGTLRNFALTMQAIEERDDQVKGVAGKRRSSLKRRSYEIITDSTADENEAEAHADALKYFWSNIRVTDATDMNRRGGFSLLVEQMMDSISKKYAVHEVIFRPTPEGLTADFHYIPLWFFENRTGKLQFLQSDYAWTGLDMDTIAPNGYMITTGDYLMSAVAVAFLWKNQGLKDWLIYAEKFGIPGVVGKTNAAYKTDAWDNMVDAVDKIANDFGGVISKDDEIVPIQWGSAGSMPQPVLVERMDRAIAALYRGADLSTMSAGQGEGSGASLQGDESDLIEKGDAQLVSETLNEWVERQVIGWHFGEGTKPLAYLKIIIPEKKDIAGMIAADRFLHEIGAPLGVDATLERYDRVKPDDDEELLAGPAKPQPDLTQGGKPVVMDEPEDENDEAANEATPGTPVERKARIALSKCMASEFAELRSRLQEIIKIDSIELRNQKLLELRQDLHKLLRDINRDPAAAKVYERAMTAAFFNGLEKGKP